MGNSVLGVVIQDKTQYQFKLTGKPEGARLARTLVSSTLTCWRLTSLVEDAKLIASELVTNACTVTPGKEIRLVIQREGEQAVFIGVWDSSDQQPTAGSTDITDTSGRGLFIVAALAAENGWYHTESGGKVVWARLAGIASTESVASTTVETQRSDHARRPGEA